MIVSNKELVNLKLDLDNGSIGDYILAAMREQRKTKTLCDAAVRCGNKEYPVHKTVMYAYSLYCRKLFSGSFPPKERDGLVIIDLDHFSENVVRVFLDIIYGDKGEDEVDIDVEELLRLADFLQADSDIDIVTEIFRNMVDADNCLELFKLAGAYNYQKLQTVALTYISCSLERLIKSDAWKKLDEMTMLSLFKHPLIQCKPDTLVGGAWKSYFGESTTLDILMGINYGTVCSRKIDMCLLKKESNVAIQRHLIDKERKKSYFVCCKELYYVNEYGNGGDKFISKYIQTRKMFLPFSRIRSNVDLKKQTVAMALVDEENRGSLILMCVPSMAYREEKQFSLVTLPIGGPFMTAADIAHIGTTFKLCDVSIVCNSRGRKIYFFEGDTIHIYDVDSQIFVENLRQLNSIDGELKHYIEFKGRVYAATHDKSTLRLYILNEMLFCWELYLEQQLKMNAIGLKSCSSSSGMAIILDNNDDCLDHIYMLVPKCKTLAFFKTSDRMLEYLFVPDHIHL